MVGTKNNGIQFYLNFDISSLYSVCFYSSKEFKIYSYSINGSISCISNLSVFRKDKSVEKERE